MTDTLLKFPCDFIVKVFGLDSDGFNQSVQAVLEKHFPGQDIPISRKKSHNKRYTALSLHLYVQSKDELDSFYKELSLHPEIIMAL